MRSERRGLRLYLLCAVTLAGVAGSTAVDPTVAVGITTDTGVAVAVVGAGVTDGGKFSSMALAGMVAAVFSGEETVRWESLSLIVALGG